MRVLYVGGWGRSGSTLLSRMLGGVPGFFVGGELRETWPRCLENRLCGCGAPFRSCVFWTRVGEEAFGGWNRANLPELVRLRRMLDRQWSVPLLMSRSTVRGSRTPVQRYVGALERLYGAIQSVSGAEVIVDSSKLPSYALLLRRMRGVDLRILHLVRDSRGVLFSWQKRLPRLDTPGEDRQMRRYGPLSGSIRYDAYNLVTRRLARLGHPYLFLRYEDLTANPETNLRRVLQHAGPDPGDGRFAFLGDGAVRLGPNHMVDAHPLRFTVGTVPLETDETWRRELSTGRRIAVSALTFPWLLRYGYIRGRAGRSDRER